MLPIKATDYRGGTEAVNTLVCSLSGRRCGRSGLTSVPRDKRAHGQCADGWAGWPGPAAEPGRLRDAPRPIASQAAPRGVPPSSHPAPSTSFEESAGSALPSWRSRDLLNAVRSASRLPGLQNPRRGAWGNQGRSSSQAARPSLHLLTCPEASPPPPKIEGTILRFCGRRGSFRHVEAAKDAGTFGNLL